MTARLPIALLVLLIGCPDVTIAPGDDDDDTNALPAIVIEEPTEQVPADTSTPLTARGSDADDAPEDLRVTFSIDDVALAADVVPDSSGLAVATGSLPAGTHVLIAVVTDPAGATGTALRTVEAVADDTGGPPRAESAEIVPAIGPADETFVAVGRGWSDPDGDPPGWQVRWFADDVEIVGETTVTLASPGLPSGTVLRAELTPFDGALSGTPVMSTPATINTPPSAPTPTIAPTQPSELQDLVCSIDLESTDPDPQVLTYTLEWFQNGVAAGLSVDGDATATLTAAASATAPGDDWECVATAHDGLEPGPAGFASVVVAPGSVLYSDIALGTGHSCALDDGAIVCWGSNTYGQVTPPTGNTFVEISAGTRHTCARRAIGTIECWGKDDWGESSAVPAQAFDDLETGGYHGCALDSAGTATCWGRGFEGQLTAPGVPLQQMSGGGYHNCGRDMNDAIVCWGSDTYGQVSGAPAGTFDDVQAAAAGAHHNCALDAGGFVTCWGSDSYGQVSGAPAGPVAAVRPGGSNTCALDLNGGIVCWGDDQVGQVSAAPTGSWTTLAWGNAHGCALDLGGVPSCWGLDGAGQATPP